MLPEPGARRKAKICPKFSQLVGRLGPCCKVGCRRLVHAPSASARYAPPVPAERLLRIGALYHGLLGLVLTLVPGGLFGFLRLEEEPRYMLFYGLAASTPLVAGIACEIARRRPDLRLGLTLGLILGNVAASVVVLFWVVWEELPMVLLSTSAAAGLWAWLLWGVYSPEESPPQTAEDE